MQIEVTIKYNLYTIKKLFKDEKKLISFLNKKRKEHDKVVRNWIYSDRTHDNPFMKVSFIHND